MSERLLLKTLHKRPLFIWDAETIGLFGECFQVGGVVCLDRKIVHEFQFTANSLQARGTVDDHNWISNNHRNSPPNALLSQLPEYLFQEWYEWKTKRPDTVMFAECPWPVEAGVLLQRFRPRQDHGEGYLTPYPLLDITSVMLAAGMDPMKTYARKPRELPEHSALPDARLSARLLLMALDKLAK